MRARENSGKAPRSTLITRPGWSGRPPGVPDGSSLTRPTGAR